MLIYLFNILRYDNSITINCTVKISFGIKIGSNYASKHQHLFLYLNNTT